MPELQPDEPSPVKRRRAGKPPLPEPVDPDGADVPRRRDPHPYERYSDRISFLPYWILLPALGCLLFAAGEVIIAVSGDHEFRVTRAVFGLALGFGPAVLIFLSHAFDGILGGDGMDSMASVLWPSGDQDASDQAHEDYGDWLSNWQRHIFGLQTRKAKIFVAAIEIMGIATLIGSGLPFSNPLLNLASVLLFALLLWFCGRAAFTFAQLLRLLTALGGRQVYVPFSRIPHPALSALLRYYSGLALLTVLGYCVLVVAVWDGPYGPTIPMIGWLTALAVFPIAMTIWSFVQIHALLRRAKQGHLDSANALVLTTMRTAGSGQVPDLEAVQKALAIQESIQGLSEWPFALSSTLAFAAALSAAAAQATLALATWWR